MKKLYYSVLLLAGLLLTTQSNAQVFSGTTTVSSSNNMTVTVTVNTNTNLATITMTGTNGSWYAYGFGGSSMNGTYALVSNGTNTITERSLGFHTGGSTLTNSTTLTGNNLSGSTRTMKVTRSITGATGSHYTFPSSAQNISIIWAKGNSSSFGQHSSSNRGSSVLSLQNMCNFPTTVLPDAQVCAGDSVQIFGNWESQAGVYNTTLTSSIGCDSVVEQTLVVNSSITNTLPSITLCNGDSVQIFGSYVSTAGNYVDTLSAAAGCDSIVDITVSTETVMATVTQNGTTLDASATNATSYDWFDCATGVSTGANTPIFTATANGSYAVIVTGKECTDTSDCYDVTGIGIAESNPLENTIYPVPFNTVLHISELNEGETITIYNTAGVAIYSKVADRDEEVLNTSEWPAGLYTVRVSSENTSPRITKIIKQ